MSMFSHYEPKVEPEKVWINCEDCNERHLAKDKHRCSLEKLIAHQMMLLECDIEEYLETLRGHFDMWYAEKHRGEQ